MTDITAKHRIITDECRKRGTDLIVAEVLLEVDSALRAAIDGWPEGEGTEIHTKVVVVRD
jgi:hypothetical protein